MQILAILGSDQMDFKASNITRDKEGHVIMTDINLTGRQNNLKFVYNQ